MLKYENIIKNLTLDEKLGLITSCKEVETRNIEGFEFPQIKVTNLDELDFNFNKVGATFNLDLIEKSGIHNGVLKLNDNDKTVLGLPVTTANKCFSKDSFLSGVFASSFAKGVEKAGALASYKFIPRITDSNIFNYANNELKSFNTALNNYEPFMIESDSSDSIFFIDKEGYEGVKVVLAKSDLDLLNSIKNKVNLTIMDNDPLELIKESIKNYSVLFKKYNDNEITLSEFYTEINSSNALNPADIDCLVDKMLDAMNRYDSQKETEYEEPNAEEEISKESIILLKNNMVLPIEVGSKVSFIGEDLIKIAELNGIDLKELIDQYGLDVKGIAHGYINDTPYNSELASKAFELINNSDYSFVFIDSLSKEKVKFIEEVKNIKDKKIIYVLLFKDNDDLTLFSDVDSLLLSFDKRIYTIKTLLALFVGEFCPSGKLPFEVKDKDNNLLFPIGAGLSFANISYSNFAINDLGVHVTVTNKSNFKAYDTLFLFAKYENDTEKELKGFKKILLNKGESQIVEFPFDFEVFKKYDVDKKYNEVLGGSYEIILAKDFITPIIEETIEVQHQDDDLKFSSNKLEAESQEIINAEPHHIMNKKGRYALITVISIYYYLLFIALMASTKNRIMLIIGGLFISIYSLFLLIYLIKNIRKKKNVNTSKEEELLDDAILKMKSFEEEYHSKYVEPKPVINEIIEEQIPEEKEENEDEEERKIEKVYSYDAFGNQVDDDNVYENEDEFEDICKKFKDYALTKGIIIELNDASNLLASIYSNNLIVINNKSKQFNERLFVILSDFLGNNITSLFSLENVNDPQDLYWIKDNDEYVMSEFSKKLSLANGYKSLLNLFVLTNVDLEKNKDILKPIIEFASSPLREHKININDEYKIKISHNSVFVLLIDDPDILNKIDKDLAACSLYMDLLTRENEFILDEVKISLNSYQYMEFLIRNYKEKYYFNEEIWKKIDELSDYPALQNFKLDNKNVNVIEKIVALVMANGSDAIEALNVVFKEKMIMLFKNLEEYKKDKGEKLIKEACEKLFDDQLDETLKLLKKN